MVKRVMLMISCRVTALFLTTVYAPHNMLLYTDKGQQTAALPVPLWRRGEKKKQGKASVSCNDLACFCMRACARLSTSTVHQCPPPDRQATDTAPQGQETFSITPLVFPFCQVAESHD